MAGAIERGYGGGLPLSRGRIVALIAVLIIGGLIGWQGYKTIYGDGSKLPAPPVTYTVQTTTVAQTATTSGTVNTQLNAKLTFAVAGRIAAINVKTGQYVRKGDVIATLDPTTFEIALAQAQSQLRSAQASLDALNNGATPDVVAAAQAGVVQAQAGVTQAQQTAQQAQNSILTAQNTYTSAVNQVTQNQAAVSTAQNNYQALINGPTPQQIAVAQAAVDTAAVNLQTAQENYDRLVNHTDIATRPETQALITASAAYQQALANLANAQQPSNPYDIQNAQNQVQAAQAAVTAAQQAAQQAQQNLLQASLEATCNTPPYVNGQYCPSDTAAYALAHGQIPGNSPAGSGGGASCQSSTCTLPSPFPSQATTNAAQQAYQTALTQAQQAAQALITAQANYQTALTNLQKLLNPITTQDLSGLQAAVAAAKANLDIAQTNYNNYITLANLDTQPETVALKQAQSAYETAIANYNNVVAPPKDTDLANAQNQITTAQAQLGSAQAAANSAAVAIDTAKSAAQSAQANVQSAQAQLDAAQKKYQQTIAPPLQTDEEKAQEAVKQAQTQVENAQYNLDNAVLRAPFDGVIAAVTANPGDPVSSGTQVAQLVDTNHIELDAQVDETTYGQIQVGMPVTVTFDTVPGQRFTGYITTIVPAGTSTQGVVTYPIVIMLNPSPVMPPAGASASQITIILQAHQNVLAVPSRYIYRDAQGNQVVDLYRNGKRVPTPVQTGISSDTLTEIVGGLHAGDVIAQPVVRRTTTTSTFGQGGLPGLGGGGGGGAAPGR